MPKLTIIVIVYNMARQAMNTLYSLSARHQHNVGEDDYEIIVVENASANMLDPSALKQLGNNIHYLRRNEAGVSPAAAINAGFKLANSDYVGLMIDGARMATPRIVEYALTAKRLSANSLVAAPSFNLGPTLQHLNIDHSYDETTEENLLKQCRWQANGYRLFDISCIGEANPRGLFQSFMESNCYFSSYSNFSDIGFSDEAFQFPGGGGLNLHMFRSIGELKQCERYFLMAGEATFHQFHGGVSTRQMEDREAMLIPPRIQLESYWGNKPFQALEREPVLLGAVSSYAQPFMKFSSKRAQKRFKRLSENNIPYWKDDVLRTKFSEQAN